MLLLGKYISVLLVAEESGFHLQIRDTGVGRSSWFSGNAS
jgi:hypothetical protein